MNKILKNSLIYSGVAIGGLAIGAGTAVAIVLPKALKAKDALGSFIPNGGATRLAERFEKNHKLKVVALGDSVTAGYNGYMGRDYYSYADFLVKSLEAATGKGKVTYKNYAKSGLRLADIKLKLESGEVSRQLKDADIIPITIGANDILAVLKMFHMPFAMSPKVLSSDPDPKNTVEFAMDYSTGKQAGKGKYNQKLFEDINKSFLSWGSTPSENIVRSGFDSGSKFSKEDSKRMLNETIKDLIQVTDGSTGQYLNLDKDWVDTVFDLVKRELATLTRDLHKAAPNAQIIILGPSLPFTQFPEDILFKPNPNLKGMNLMEAFDKLLDSMKEGAKTTMGDSNDFIDFYKADELEFFKPYSWKLLEISENEDKISDLYKEIDSQTKTMASLTTSANETKDKAKKAEYNKKVVDAQKKYDKYEKDLANLLKTLRGKRFKKVDYSTIDKYKKSVKENPQPNILDIHPTVFGHQLIGNSLFKKVANVIGLSDANVKKGLDAAKSNANNPNVDVLFERTDEDDSTLKKSYMASKVTNTLLSSLKKLPDGLLDGLNKTMMKEVAKFDPKNPNGKKLTTKDDKAAFTEDGYYAKVFFEYLERTLIKFMGLKTQAELEKKLTFQFMGTQLSGYPILKQYLLTGNGTLLRMKFSSVKDLKVHQTINGAKEHIIEYVASLYWQSKGKDASGKALTEKEFSNWSISGIASFFQTTQNLANILQTLLPLMTQI